MFKKSLYIFLLGISTTYAQNIIAIQSFETSGDSWAPISFSTPPCTQGNSVWNYVSSLPGIQPSAGNQFWGIRNLNGSCGGNDFESISLPNISINAYSNVTFSFDYYAIGFDNDEDLKYELFYDDISQGEVLVVDGINGNSDNTNGWLTETVSIPVGVNNVKVIFSAKNNQNNERAGFDNIKLFESAIPNDTCMGASTLIVGANNTENLVTGTNVGATSSGQLPNPQCANYQGNDVWYTAQVPASGNITIETLNAGSTIDTAIEVYSGSCASLTQLACHDDKNYPSDLYSRIDLTGLANTTIFIRVWAWSNSSSGNFNIVAYSLPPLANNDCLNAQNLIVGSDNTQNVITGTNINASSSGELPNPNCANYNGRDVWYAAIIPASGILTIETQDAGSNIDTAIEAYTGACGSLIAIACDDDSGPGLYSTLNLTGLPNTMIYIRVWSWNNASEGEFNIVAYTPTCPLSTTWNGNNWNNGQPNSFTTAVINGDYDTAINGSIETCDCNIANTSVVNVRANEHLTVYNNLTVDGVLEVRHEGSLLMTNDLALVNSPGTVNVYKTSTPFNQYDYTYWSSPMEDETIGSALAGSVANRIYSFNTSIYNELTTNGWTAVGAAATMQQGTGYIAMGPTSGTFPQSQDVVFDGQLSNGVIATPIALSADTTKDYEDWNLIGNPYASALNADLLLSNPLNTSVVSGTIYLWTHNTMRNTNQGEQDYNSNDYATYTFGTGGVAASSGGEKPTGLIASGQGFFIDGEANGNLTFNNTMRVNTGNDQFFRTPDLNSKSESSKTDKIWLDLSNDKGAFNQLLVGFIDGATDGLDRAYDGIKFGGGWVSFYSIFEDVNLAVQGKSSLIDDQIIPLGFASYVEPGEELKISIANIEGNALYNEFDILLNDKYLNQTYDLALGDYRFSMEDTGVFNDRFELILNNKSVLNLDESLIENRLIIGSINDRLHIKTSDHSIIKKFMAYDLIGKKIIDKSSDNNELSIYIGHINKGTVLVVNVLLEDNSTLSTKIILN